jgi:hypothetical protein
VMRIGEDELNPPKRKVTQNDIVSDRGNDRGSPQ